MLAKPWSRAEVANIVNHTAELIECLKGSPGQVDVQVNEGTALSDLLIDWSLRNLLEERALYPISRRIIPDEVSKFLGSLDPEKHAFILSAQKAVQKKLKNNDFNITLATDRYAERLNGNCKMR